MHKMLLGIEHLMTGVQLRVDMSLPDYQETLQFQQESPSVVRVICAEKFNAYWPQRHSYLLGRHSQVFLSSVECTPEEEKTYEALKYGAGEAEWWAQVAGEALRQTYHLPTANIREHQPPDTVIRAMRRKHGKEADKYIQQLRWDAMNKCWFYTYAGMYLGVEQDGYIHS